ncbi:FAD-dependent oxidoreductase [Desulfotignum balticum]|jgi:NADPH-dependent glutamate synthase beta subunit-like oxidoreductase/Na+-translocating ferredoxin:NAD+ oxidoreductase RNF subunit RnfB|uniref:FAD-dependent oxidoreductase n=1 Tax=Desulfotignum balticum TaxID=115781 RepID=UPI0003FCA006|nr:FAD-dependent oxidoreductase [Desulfotignum balticum]
MIQSILMMGGLGVVIGTALVIASKAFYVYEDPKVLAIDDVLPGANCGGCGMPGCTANAQAIVAGKASVNSCVAAGDDVAQAIAAIMGVSVAEKEPEFAAPGCYYGNNKADLNYAYQGIRDCRAAAMLLGGMKVCHIGCLGLGTCVTACMFNALSMGPDGLPVVDQEKCTGCGACEKICPKNIIRLTSVTRRIIREYTIQDCTTPCQRACPSGLDIRKYVGLIQEGDYAGSLAVIKERMPFPSVISRICPALCEFDCRRLLQDETVAINDLKRFVCDYERKQSQRIQPYKAPATDKNVAVIGGGVEGLAAAYFTARLGHAATVFEKTEVLGGILRTAIARERLTMDLLDWDIQGIQDLGVTFKTGVSAGTDITIPQLLAGEGFDAVFIATGGWDSRMARNEGDNPTPLFPGAHLLIDLVRSGQNENITVACGKHAVITGGGKFLAKAVTTLLEKGVETVTVVSRKPEDDPDVDLTNLDAEAAQAVTVVYNTGITKVMGQEENLTGVEAVDLSSGEKREIAADTLIIGAGRFPELVFVPVKETDENGEMIAGGALAWEGLELPKKPDVPPQIGLLSKQDVISEYPSAVAAINGGRKAAAAVHHFMYGLEFQDPDLLITQHSRIQNVTQIQQVETTPKTAWDDLAQPMAAATGFSEAKARKEANRCLQCGLICYEKQKA